MLRKNFHSLRAVILAIFIFLLAGDIHFAQKDPASASGDVNWDKRINGLLKASKGDIILTAVGDMIFNREISHFTESHYQNLYRILKNAKLAYGNLEMSLNEKSEFQIGFRDFRRGRDFAWEIARIGIDTVSLANNHSLDYGKEGLKDCLRILRQSRIRYAGAGLNLAEARAARYGGIHRTRFAFLSFYSSGDSLRTNPEGPTIATIGASSVLIEKENGSIEAIRAPFERDVMAMEDAISTAKRHADIVMVAFHFHWVSHSRAYPVPDKVPPNQSLVVHKAIDAGADIILGSGPHVLRGIEIYKGKPIFYSLGDFIYQYKTPPEVPEVSWQRGAQTDIREEFETVVARLTVRDKKVYKIELIPVTLDMKGPRYACPRLANDIRGKEIVELLQRLSKRFKTKISYKDWYGEVEM